MNVQRGEVVLVDFPYAGGSGSKVRPALVIQNDRDNARQRVRGIISTGALKEQARRTVRGEFATSGAAWQTRGADVTPCSPSTCVVCWQRVCEIISGRVNNRVYGGGQKRGEQLQ